MGKSGHIYIDRAVVTVSHSAIVKALREATLDNLGFSPGSWARDDGVVLKQIGEMIIEELDAAKGRSK